MNGPDFILSPGRLAAICAPDLHRLERLAKKPMHVVIPAMTLFDLAMEKTEAVVLSTIMEAGLFRKEFATDEGITRAIDWCRNNGITRVYIESFRTAYDADPHRVRHAAGMFAAAGIDVAGGVTPTRIGKPSNGWNLVSCYTHPSTQEKLQQIFEDAARLFDLVMIDDFLFTDCTCEECTAARGEQTWADYRRALMLRLTHERILGPARKANPNVKIILKYPQWYDRYHVCGYDVLKQTEAFDLTWAGTELRDPDHQTTLPRVPQYEGFFVMRWLSHFAGGQDGRCGGGWFDEIVTSPQTYLEQAWQTILGGGREMVLFFYSSLTKPAGEACLAALRAELPAMFELAELTRARHLLHGVHAPKPANSTAHDGPLLFDHVGMLGLPLIPTSQLDPASPVALISAENLDDPTIEQRLRELLHRGNMALVTDGLLAGLNVTDLAEHPGLLCINVQRNPQSLLSLPAEVLQRIRRHALAPLGITLEGPTRIALTLLGDDLAAVSNFGFEPAEIVLTRGGRRTQPLLTIPARPLPEESRGYTLPPRSLTVYRFV